MATTQATTQDCRQCGREITPAINRPDPSSGRYNGYADCPSCGAILWTIPGYAFEEDEDEDENDG